MKRLLLGLVALAACGTGKNAQVLDAPVGNNDAPPADGPSQCTTALTFDPHEPISGPGNQLRAIGSAVGGQGVAGYTWDVTFNGAEVAFSDASADHSEITFPIPTAGPYTVDLQIHGVSPPCTELRLAKNVEAPGANLATFRLHITPPATAGAPPLDRPFPVHGGGDAVLGSVVLDQGFVINAQVKTATNTSVPAYVRFTTTGIPDAVVEAFAGVNGNFTARVASQLQDILVVPAIPGIAPQRFDNVSPSSLTVVTLDPGTAVSGFVRGPSNAVIAGAAVQLMIDGVPSTLTTTAADGSFTVRAVPTSGATVIVDVTPPAATGLPRLVASSQMLDLSGTQTLQIRYAASLATRNVGSASVKRGNVAVPGAGVDLVGTVANAGTVTAGAVATAQGAVRIALVTDGAGSLPSALAPAVPLSAVVTVGPGDLAVAAFDLSAGVPAAILAPPVVPIVSQVVDSSALGLHNVVIDVVPVGKLALAGVETTQLLSGAGGTISASFASGGHYDLRLHDPAGRGAPLVVSDVSAGSLAASYALPKAIHVNGSLTVAGDPSPVAGASVQVLCDQCSGPERMRPLAEVATDATGQFVMAVADPGTM